MSRVSCLWITVLLVGVALVAGGMAGVAERFQYEPAMSGSGEWWRVVTCHFVHYSPDHLLWNLLAFGAMSAACERGHRLAWLWVLALSVVAIPLAVLVFQPGLPAYRGLSGLASAGFTLLAARLGQPAATGSWRLRAVFAWSLVGLFAAKTVYELVHGEAVFVDGAVAGFVPVPLAHAVGGALGLGVGWLEGRLEGWRELGPARRGACASCPAQP